MTKEALYLYNEYRSSDCKSFTDFLINKIAELKSDNDARKFAMAMSEKVEKQLREENAELRAIAENQQSSNMSRYFENKKLKEGLAVGSTLNKGLNSLNKALEEERDKYRNMVFDKDEHLTKAKEHIENLLYYVKQCTCERSNYAEIEKDIKEAEQFIKDSEVEK